MEVDARHTVAEMDRLGDEIAELSAHLEAATARLLDLIREFDAGNGWNTGFRSCAHWLAWRVGLDLGAARERVRVARALGSLPRLTEALSRGELSYAKVRALTRVATPETEDRLLAVGRAGTACHVERIVRGWRRVDQTAEARQTMQRQRSRALHVYQDEDGMVVVRGRLTPEAGALLMQALSAAREALYRRTRDTDDVSAGTPSMTQVQADALALVAETALHHDVDSGASGERYQVVPPSGLRCDARGDAPRSGWTSRGSGCADANHSASAPARAPSPRPGLSISRLQRVVRSGAPHPSLGRRRTHDTLESRSPVSAPSSSRPRAGIPVGTSRRR